VHSDFIETTSNSDGCIANHNVVYLVENIYSRASVYSDLAFHQPESFVIFSCSNPQAERFVVLIHLRTLPVRTFWFILSFSQNHDAHHHGW